MAGLSTDARSVRPRGRQQVKMAEHTQPLHSHSKDTDHPPGQLAQLGRQKRIPTHCISPTQDLEG